MHRTLVVVALGACTFRTPPEPASGDGDDAGAPASGIDGALGVAGCHTADPNVRLCIDFEDSSLTPTSDDGSPAHKNNVTTSGIRPMTRSSQHAAMLDIDSSLTIAETPSLDITGDLTIELWANPQPLPATDRYWMFDNNTQYGMELMMDGAVRCDIGGMVMENPTPIDGGEWVHLACVYDSSAGTLAVFVDGSSVGACKKVANPPTGGMDGSAIGGNISAGGTIMKQFLGGIDNVAVYAEALMPSTICQLAGHSNCGPYICETTGL